MKTFVMVAGWVVLVSALNVGLMGLLGTDMLGSILGADMTRIWNIFVGVCAVVMAYKMVGMKK